MSTVSRRESAFVTAAAVGLTALVLWNSVHKSMWTDESYSLNTAMRPLAATIHQAVHFELQPPLYFMALNGWLRLHGGIIYARLLSLGCVLGALGVLFRIGQLVGIRGWLTPALLAAATPGVIWAADEARVYAMSLLLASVTLYWYLRLIVDPGEHPARATVLYAVFAYLSVFTFYYNGFLLLGQWIGALVVRRRVRRITGALAVVGIGIVPWVPTILSQSAAHPIETPIGEGALLHAHPLYVVAGTPLKAVLTDTDWLHFAHWVIVIWAIVIAVLVLRAAWGDGEKRTPAELALITAVIVPLVALGALMYFEKIPIRHRHFILVIPATLTLLALWISRTRRGAPRTVASTLLLALLLVFIVGFEIDPQYPEDWRQVADYLAGHAAPGERVVVFDPDRVLALQYYLGRRERASGLPVDPDLEHYAPDQYAIRDTAMIAARLDALGATGGIWLVEAARLMPDLQPSVDVIDGYMRRHYVVGTPIHFRGVQVTHMTAYAR
jgi:mannosyltransferase